eukprot:scaffold61087_cov17-Prasinocladus_malaysianus.AAC.1
MAIDSMRQTGKDKLWVEQLREIATCKAIRCLSLVVLNLRADPCSGALTEEQEGPALAIHWYDGKQIALFSLDLYTLSEVRVSCKARPKHNC